MIDLFNFTIYVRLVIETYQMLLISSFSEVLRLNFYTVANGISLLFSIGMIVI